MESSTTPQEGIKVAIRVRPLNDREVRDGQGTIYQCQTTTNSIAQINQSADVQPYFYDKVFDEKATTIDLHDYVAKDIVSDVVRGINGTIFACKDNSSTSSLIIMLIFF